MKKTLNILVGLLTVCLVLALTLNVLFITGVVHGAVGPKGETGAAGTAGKDGEDGTNGKSAFEIFQDLNPEWKDKTEAEWMTWLQEELKGKDGVDGKDGKDGIDGTNGTNGTNGKDGVDGKDGKDGVDGKDGKDGEDGKTPDIQIKDGFWWVNGENTGWKAVPDKQFTATDAMPDVSEAIEGDFCVITYSNSAFLTGTITYRMEGGKWVVAEDNTTATSNEELATKGNEFHINTLAELKAFRDSVNSGMTYNKKTVYLDADIDLSSEENWEPIGKLNSLPFSGTFEGQNHTISNLKITAGLYNSGVNCFKGLFGRLGNGTLQNFTIENAEVSGSLFVAAVAGQPYTGKIQNVTVKGDINIKAWWYVGTIGGGNNAYADICDCKVLANEGSTIWFNGGYGGGIVGHSGEGTHNISRNTVKNLTIINEALEDSPVSNGGARIGGITGLAHYKNIVSDNELYNVTLILRDAESGDAGAVGAIAGTFHSKDKNGYDNPATVSNNKGDVTIIAEDSSMTLGGIVGAPWNNDSNHQVTLQDNDVTVTWNGEVVTPTLAVAPVQVRKQELDVYA